MLPAAVALLSFLLIMVQGQQNFTRTPITTIKIPATTSSISSINVTSVKWANNSMDKSSALLPTGAFLEADQLEEDESNNSATEDVSIQSINDTDSALPEGRSFFDDLPISPLGGFKKYEKSYVNVPGFSAGKEKVEGGGLMPSPLPIPGMVSLPFYSPFQGGAFGPYSGGFGAAGAPFQGGPVGYPSPGGFYNAPSSYPPQTYNVGPSPYLAQAVPGPYGPYPGENNRPSPIINVAPPVGFPVSGNSELSNFINAIRNRPIASPIRGRPLPAHCNCKKLADCRDVSRFARMYADDDEAYDGQCLPSFVVCCNPELLEQQKQALRPGNVIAHPAPIIVAQPPPSAGSFPLIGPPKIVPISAGLGPALPPPIGQIGAVCGRKGKNPLARVLDDSLQRSETEFGEYPWMAAILLSDLTYVCGGALIGNKFVLTAAHCISKHKNRNLIVRLGEYDVQETSEPPFQDYKVVDAIIHASYHSGTLRNDMALLILELPVKYNSYIAPVCLPEPGVSYGPGLCSVTGWGKDTIAHGKWSSILKAVKVPLVTNEFCENSYRKSPELGNFFNLDSSFVCAGAPGKDACYGDGGSPLVCPINGVYQLVGLVSWGIDCGQYPGVYARVDKFLPWIVDVTKQYT